jgi:hypothetical protein
MVEEKKRGDEKFLLMGTWGGEEVTKKASVTMGTGKGHHLFSYHLVLKRAVLCHLLFQPCGPSM